MINMLHYLTKVVEQELLTLPEHLSSPPVFSGVRVTRSLALYICFQIYTLKRLLPVVIVVNAYVYLFMVW
jgi:hypothetical protein